MNRFEPMFAGDIRRQRVSHMQGFRRDTKVHLYRTPTLVAIMWWKGVVRDTLLDTEEFDGSWHVYAIGLGEALAAFEQNG